MEVVDFDVKMILVALTELIPETVYGRRGVRGWIFPARDARALKYRVRIPPATLFHLLESALRVRSTQKKCFGTNITHVWNGICARIQFEGTTIRALIRAPVRG